MAKEPIGITFIVPDNEDPIGVYESDGGIEVFETDEPYLLSDGKSLVDPMPVRMVDGPIYQDTLGNAQSALAITLASSWSPADLFANSEQGSLWGPLPYYSDSAGTVEAGWGDPVGNIPDASGNELDWTQVTSTAQPILRDSPPRLEFDGTDDLVTTTLPAISGGTIVLAGVNGIWIDEIDFAGGAFSVGPGTYTGGPTGLMSILGDILVGGGFVIDRALTPEEIEQVKGYYKARGAGDFFVPLDPSVVAVIRPTVDTAPKDWIRYHNGKSYPDGPEWQDIIDTHPTYAGIASEVIDSQHMVKVPKYYVQTKDTAAGGVIYLVSDTPQPGFQVHPAFYSAGEEIDQFWIGAYHASEVDNIFESQPNVLPRVSLSGVTAVERMEARNTGGQTGWGSMTWHQICAVKLLCLIEIGTPDPRSAIGPGWNSTTSNSGSGVELQPTGTSDANWRGIYDLYGNVHQLCTGIETRDGVIWVADENGDLVETEHEMPAADRYIGACYGDDLAWAFLPTDYGPTSSAAGYTAYAWRRDGTRAVRHGGSFDDHPARVGLFSFHGRYTLALAFTGCGFRLAKV